MTVLNIVGTFFVHLSTNYILCHLNQFNSNILPLYVFFIRKEKNNRYDICLRILKNQTDKQTLLSLELFEE